MRAAKLTLAIAVSATAVPALASVWNTPESRARWKDLSTAVYGPDAAQLKSAGNRLVIDSPDVAQDAALVPVTLKVAPDLGAKEVDLIIDRTRRLSPRRSPSGRPATPGR